MRPPVGPPDAALLALAQAGDEDAFAALVERYQDYIFHLCARVSGSRADAADLCQDCFLKLHRHLGRIDPARKLSNWLYTVALNDCRALLRRRKIARFFSLDARREDGLAFDPPAPGASPAQQAEQGQLRRALAQAVQTLPQSMREAFVLRHELELSHAEVAEQLDMQEGAVRVLMHRARQRLRKEMEALGHGMALGPAKDDDDEA
jgi:RNA polymerase sigma-70 factor (ECF subfamily)